jgi:hypothetical protein
MEKNKGLPGMDGAVMEGLHVGQASETSVLLGSKKGAHVDDEEAIFGHMHDKVISGNNSKLRWKRADRTQDALHKTGEVVGQPTKKSGHTGPKKVVHVETLGAVSGHMQDITTAENTTQQCRKRNGKSHEVLSQIEHSITITGKRRKASAQAENGLVGGKKNKHEVEAATEENLGKAAAAK